MPNYNLQKKNKKKNYEKEKNYKKVILIFALIADI